MWKLMPQHLRKYETERGKNGKKAIIVVTNKKYGDSVDDEIVILRLGTFMPMLKEFIYSDLERNTEDVTSTN